MTVTLTHPILNLSFLIIHHKQTAHQMYQHIPTLAGVSLEGEGLPEVIMTLWKLHMDITTQPVILLPRTPPLQTMEQVRVMSMDLDLTMIRLHLRILGAMTQGQATTLIPAMTLAQAPATLPHHLTDIP